MDHAREINSNEVGEVGQNSGECFAGMVLATDQGEPFEAIATSESAEKVIREVGAVV